MDDYDELVHPMESLLCPHCLVTIYVGWDNARIANDPKGGVWGAKSTTCPACKKVVIRLIRQGTLTLGNTHIPFGKTEVDLNRAGFPGDRFS